MKPRLGIGRCFCRSKRIAWATVLWFSLMGPLASSLSAQVDAASSPNPALFAGTWKGVCQDGKPFVLITLRFVANKVEGTVSLGNIKLGEPAANGAGTCTSTTPATAEHSMPILSAMVDGKRLVFDSRGPQLEMILTGDATAQLRFPSESMAASYFEIHKASP